MIRDHIRLVLKNMRSRKLRNFLTLVGIVIGVTAIILLYTTGQGLEDVAGREFDKFGARQILVGPSNVNAIGGGPQGAQGFTIDDAEFLSKLSVVETAIYVYRENAEIEFNKETNLALVGSADTNNLEKTFKDSGLKAAEGRTLLDGDSGKIAVMGWVIAKESFDKEIFVNQKILVNNIDVKIIGILEKTGSQADDQSLFMPYDAGKEIFELDNNEIKAVGLNIKEGVDLDEAEQIIKKEFEKKRDEEDFTVTNPTQLAEQSKNILGVVKLVIVAIGLISLFVGGIGIMNSMYTAVLERTKEIGTMKAIGSTNKDILTIFLIESSIMGLIGGILAGLFSILGIIGLKSVFSNLSVVPIEITFDPWLFAFAILFSLVTGVAAGLWPAIKAARLKPVDALRYE